jgi:phage terminase large subunit-like protein
MKKEGGHSPDRADALAMAFYTGQIKNPQIRWL